LTPGTTAGEQPAVLGTVSGGGAVIGTDSTEFTAFVEMFGRQLHQALIAAYGLQVGEEVTSEALAYAWEHWDKIRAMSNPVGYLYRVGQSRSRRGLFRRPPPQLYPGPPVHDAGWFEPGLPAALARLSRRQRAAVVLVHGFGWTPTEVARMWGVSFSTVQAHVKKALFRLRRDLGVEK
jgi:DNA-directed RNA polymerase specialized sigma24 family protein